MSSVGSESLFSFVGDGYMIAKNNIKGSEDAFFIKKRAPELVMELVDGTTMVSTAPTSLTN